MQPSDSSPSAADLPLASLSSDVRRTVLPNGLTVLVKEVYPAQVVSLGLWARVGSADETEDRAGTSHFLEHMLFKGTPTRPVGTIAQQVHRIGGYMNAFTSYDCTCYWMVVPSRHLDTALEIQFDALLHSLFDAEEVAKEAQVILEELRMYQDRPSSFCSEQLMGLMFPDSPYGRPIIGHPAIVTGMQRGSLLDWHHRLYQPSNLALVLVGDVDNTAVIATITRLSGAAPPSPSPRTVWPVATDSPPGKHRLDLTGPIHSAHLQVGFRVPSILSAETYACDLLSSILGGGRSSRLYQSLREELGLVSHIGSSVSAEREAGVLSIEAVHTPGRSDEVLTAIRRQIDGVMTHPPDEEELQKAKNMVEAAYVFSQETVEGQGRKLGYGEMLGDYRLAERYVEHLYQVTRQDVLERAQRYLSRDDGYVVSYQPSS